VRFRTRQKPHGLLNRRDQHRLTLMIVAVGIVILSINVVRQPEFWARMFPDPNTDSAGISETQQTVGGDNSHSWVYMAMRPNFTVGDGSDWPAETVPDDLLATVEDNVIGVGSGEARAYLVSLRLAGKISPETAKQLPSVRYALLMDSPAACRGKAWKVVGTLRRLTVESLTDDRFGVDRVVEAWLSLPDSGSRLVRVVALSKDPALAEGVQATNDPPQVRFSGYFFKKEAYAASGGGLRIAPLMLAGRISLVPVFPVSETRSDQLTPWLGWLTVLTCCGIVLMVITFTMSDVVSRRQRIHELTQLPATVTFDGVDAVSPAESLRALEASAAAETVTPPIHDES